MIQVYVHSIILSIIFLCILKYILIIPIVDGIYRYKMIREFMKGKLNEGFREVETYLDSIITDSIAEYQSLNPAEVMKNEYITESKEIEIREEVKELVKNRLSGAVLVVLELYYKSVEDAIARKIYIAVTSFVVSHNMTSFD